MASYLASIFGTEQDKASDSPIISTSPLVLPRGKHLLPALLFAGLQRGSLSN